MTTLGIATFAEQLRKDGIAMAHVRVDQAIATTLTAEITAPIPQPVAVVFVIDRGFSMKGVKLESTKQLVRDTIAGMSIHDSFAVATFESEAELLVPMQRTNVQAASIVKYIEHGVGSQLYAGMRIARDALANVAQARKHIIVLTDGDGVARDGLAELAQDIAAARIELTMIGVGTYERDLLQMVAEAANGSVEELAKQTAGKIVQRLRGP